LLICYEKRAFYLGTHRTTMQTSSRASISQRESCGGVMGRTKQNMGTQRKKNSTEIMFTSAARQREMRSCPQILLASVKKNQKPVAHHRSLSPCTTAFARQSREGSCPQWGSLKSSAGEREREESREEEASRGEVASRGRSWVGAWVGASAWLLWEDRVDRAGVSCGQSRPQCAR